MPCATAVSAVTELHTVLIQVILLLLFATVTRERPSLRKLLKIRFRTVDNYGPQRFLRKIVQPKPNHLPLECSLKDVRAFLCRFPIDSGLLQLLKKFGHVRYCSLFFASPRWPC